MTDRAPRRPTRRPAQRADDSRILLSDAERDEAVHRIQRACIDGRLTLGEFGDRLERALASQTRGDLRPLVGDLPAPAPAVTASPTPVVALPAPQRTRVSVSILGLHHHQGRWALPTNLLHVGVLGTTILDLSEAVLPHGETTITVFSLLGSEFVRVPDGVRVEVSGLSLLGSRHLDSGTVPPTPDAPLVHLRLFSVLGSVGLRRGGPGLPGLGDWRFRRRELRRMRRWERRGWVGPGGALYGGDGDVTDQPWRG